MIWRWIPPLEADGTTQMALDSWMLTQLSRSGAGPMLRLYRWSRPTLSLGVHQRRLEPHWPALVRAGVVDIVRRPSGGRAVLHAGELSYALVMRPATTRRLEAYRQACSWLQHAFAALGHPLHFGAAAASGQATASSCFATSTAADLVDQQARKRIGSAQLWRGNALLQHGSLLLAPPAGLWRQVFGADPPALTGALAADALLENHLRSAAAHHLCGGPLVARALTPAEWQAVLAVRSLYTPSPDCRERATEASAIPSG